MFKGDMNFKISRFKLMKQEKNYYIGVILFLWYNGNKEGEMKRLYEIEEYKRVKLYVEDERGKEIVIIYDHIDGLYSYCWLEEDRENIVHIKATTLFREYKDGYKYVEEE